MATIRQIARACNVSPMTVSLLNNRVGEISEETRERALREMGYRPHATTQKRPAKIHTIGISAGVPNVSFVRDGYFSALLREATDRVFCVERCRRAARFDRPTKGRVENAGAGFGDRRGR